ncbi:AbrB/MazE/SpoVT family DNA-binding domain-containing protein [Tuberibacillus sp. Marseille-P3662]|uniref:AbrB/MazE/SpoVT family DNA-binding domain-containing protein n=1 Tax=Tuberibacillus sp. Marseille-P3662 TaxID=1965358 RepID=UPI000A1CEE46|nr:AbrB/MazE/SpoVT family DNA-binding domain-containing protein [Tuberibacillus sp. Marseille-P3662]
MGDYHISGRITSKGQVTIPAEIRKELNLEEGDRIQFVHEGSALYNIQTVKKKSLKDVVGKLQTNQSTISSESKDVVYKKMAEANLLKDLDEENRQ